MLRIVVALFIGAHGIGHLLFLLSVLGVVDWGQSTHSWLMIGETPTRLIGGALWIVTIAAFSIAVYGLLDQQSWWRSIAIFAASISTIGLIIFWTNPATSPAISALVFNVLLLGLLLITRWPSVDAVGA